LVLSLISVSLLSNQENYICYHCLSGDWFMKLKVVLEKSEEGGYTVFVPSLPGCISEGDTRDEAIANIREAIELYLEPAVDDSNFEQNAEIVELAI
jgi:predicted RNase H-like HicB family nuclease